MKHTKYIQDDYLTITKGINSVNLRYIQFFEPLLNYRIIIISNLLNHLPYCLLLAMWVQVIPAFLPSGLPLDLLIPRGYQAIIFVVHLLSVLLARRKNLEEKIYFLRSFFVISSMFRSMERCVTFSFFFMLVLGVQVSYAQATTASTH